MSESKHSECFRAFFHTSESWYEKTSLDYMEETDSIYLGFYHPDGGTTGEFSIKWFSCGGESAPRLEIFNDAWDALNECQDLIKVLAENDDKNVTPKEMCDILKKLGFTDQTQRKKP